MMPAMASSQFSEAFTLLHGELIIGLAARYRISAVYPYRYFPAEDGLLSYGTESADQYRQGASYINAILRGARCSELPVQAQTKFDRVIKLKIAKMLALKVPLALLIRANEVIA
jgi:putative tryptophan/tyrosine transport system substrate-binding protein